MGAEVHTPAAAEAASFSPKRPPVAGLDDHPSDRDDQDEQEEAPDDVEHAKDESYDAALGVPCHEERKQEQEDKGHSALSGWKTYLFSNTIKGFCQDHGSIAEIKASCYTFCVF